LVMGLNLNGLVGLEFGCRSLKVLFSWPGNDDQNGRVKGEQ